MNEKFDTLLEQAYLSINALLSDGYEAFNFAFRCKRCGSVSLRNPDKSSMRLVHDSECAAGKAIAIMRDIEKAGVLGIESYSLKETNTSAGGNMSEFERGAKAMQLAAKERCRKQHATCDKSNVACHMIDAEAIMAIDVAVLVQPHPLYKDFLANAGKFGNPKTNESNSNK